MPPQTPNSTRLSRASARHSVRTGQPRQMLFARFCLAPWTNRVSGALSRHAARVVQSGVQGIVDVLHGVRKSGAAPPGATTYDRTNRTQGTTVPVRLILG